MPHTRVFLVALVAAAIAIVSTPPCLAFLPTKSLRSAQIPHVRQGTTSTTTAVATRTTNSALLLNRAASASSSSSSSSPPRRLLPKHAMASSVSSSSSSSGGRTIVVVGLNGALQRTIVFAPPKGLKVGDVNRASSVGAGIGGKGQNVCVALRTLAEEAGEDGGVDVTLAHFVGGKSGIGGKGQNVCVALRKLAEEAGDDGGVDVTLAHVAGGKSGEAVCEGLSALGVKLVNSTTAAEMRLCTSLVDERFGETTEIIEPWSAEITDLEKQSLVSGCKSTFAALPCINGVAVMGSSPAGVGKDTLVDIMAAITGSPGFKGAETRVLVDSIVGFEALVGSGHISLLKVNAEEAVSLAESGREGAGAEWERVSVWMEDKLARAAVELFERHGDHLPWIAVTNGGLPAYLFSREFLEKDSSLSSFWRLFPAPVEAINPIGAGDAVAAATLYEWTRGVPVPEAFRRALSVGGAACTSRDPVCNSRFSVEEAGRLLPDVRLEKIESTKK